MIIFDIGLIAAIAAVIAGFIILAANMGIAGICQIILDNKEETLLITTLIIFVISFIVSCIINSGRDRKTNSFFYVCGLSISLTFSLSASTVLNIYNTVHTVQYLHDEFDLAIRIIFFILPLIYIILLIILYVISYAVGLLAIAPRLLVEDSDATNIRMHIIRAFSFIVPIVLYIIIAYLLLTNNDSIFTIFS